ncbi:MAG: radical SAM protein, partial [Thermodesulfovibrionales bacterium]|nr:radical SAM protein [Thermodesulfovibrionales bacterium]
MSNVNTNYDDFASKLRQHSIIETLRRYILWQRGIRDSNKTTALRNSGSSDFSEGPVSINLDITVACNYSCTHCVDAKILNTGDKFSQVEIFKTIEVLRSNGLKSIILIGGGEPLLHPQFEAVVHYIKTFGLQLSIVTNGSNISKLIKIAGHLGEKDWIRFSLDAGSDKT